MSRTHAGLPALPLFLVLVLAACSTPPAPASAPPVADTEVALVLANATVVTMDGSSRVISPGSVAIDKNQIVAVDTADVIAEKYRGSERIDARRPDRDARA